jgi:heme/copper-type cytochrome/quinol oxidase subunit 4
MSILEEECYKQHKIETAILLITAMLIGFVWSSLDAVLPFAATTQTTLSYTMKMVGSGIIIIASLLTYVYYLHKKFKQIPTSLTLNVVHSSTEEAKKASIQEGSKK